MATLRTSALPLAGSSQAAIGFFIPEAIYTGYGMLQNAFPGKCTLVLLFAVAIAKCFSTASSIATGGSGGVFGPSVVIEGEGGLAQV